MIKYCLCTLHVNVITCECDLFKPTKSPDEREHTYLVKYVTYKKWFKIWLFGYFLAPLCENCNMHVCMHITILCLKENQKQIYEQFTLGRMIV